MNTGKDYGLPEEYHDWVRVDDGWIPTGRRIHLDWAEFGADGICDARSGDIHFVPPKPKPTLPDVGPGAVISWQANDRCKRRGTLLSDGRWQVAVRSVDSGRILGAHAFWHNDDLLADVNDDGFTVELEGL